MRKILLAFLLPAILSAGCGSTSKSTSASGQTYKKSQAELLDHNTFVLTAISEDDSYGYTEKNPVMVGGVNSSEGPLNERRFLNALLGPDGQKVTYHRTGSCCPFKSPNGMFNNGALLDRYEVTYDGLSKPVFIYINMYDFGLLVAPKGFTIRKNTGI
jgi:hypothetical protein